MRDAAKPSRLHDAIDLLAEHCADIIASVVVPLDGETRDDEPDERNT